MQPPVHLPDFIPQDLLNDHGDEARRLVEQRASSRRRSPAGLPLRPAALIALPGIVILSALWAWLAITTGDPLWWFAAAGGVTSAAVFAATVGGSFCRSLTHRTTATTRSSAPAAPPTPLQHAGRAS